MAKGKSIYFTSMELEILLEVIKEWDDNVGEDIYARRLSNGLGTAWGKLTEANNKTTN